MKALRLTYALLLSIGLIGCQNLQLGASPIPVIAYTTASLTP